MSAPMTSAELFTLFPATGNAETEAARGRFLAALRLVQALTPRVTLARFRAWNERRQAAAMLRSLSDEMLNDIGLTRGEIDRIAAAGEGPAQPAMAPRVHAYHRARHA